MNLITDITHMGAGPHGKGDKKPQNKQLCLLLFLLVPALHSMCSRIIYLEGLLATSESYN